ncbi:PilZ domain-containing protein [Rhizobium lemnae]|uniref:PilZ domain-containing protein n=1 Tax=Rhizobium lemnae TaxID=1214924 RepID=A0ABV8E858_9HYPH|nr:PilZ domain-containing protein [Rhizobium lemnae]MCJ8506998.1 PilZ domain-containing protein [Rhizobium lemnae]
MLRHQAIKARHTARHNTRIVATIRYGEHDRSGQVINLSGSGLAIQLERPLFASVGARICVTCDALGLLEGSVKWSEGVRLGVQFDRSSNAWAKVASYFRFYHTTSRPKR